MNIPKGTVPHFPVEDDQLILADIDVTNIPGLPDNQLRRLAYLVSIELFERQCIADDDPATMVEEALS